jgi:hypothetical protein
MCAKENHKERHIDHPKNCKKILHVAGTTTCQHRSLATQCKRQRHDVCIGAGATNSTSAILLSAISNSSVIAIFSACAGTSTSNEMRFSLQHKGQHQRQCQNQHHHQCQRQRHAIVLSTIYNSSVSAIFNVCAGSSTSNAM